MENLEELRKIHIKNINSVERVPETKLILQQIENCSNIDQLNLIFEKYWRIYKSRGIKYNFHNKNNYENKNIYSVHDYSSEILNAKDIYEINLIDEKYLIIQLSKTNSKIYLNKYEIKKCKKYSDLVKLIKIILLSYKYQLDNLDQKLKVYNHQYLPQLINNYHYFNRLMKLDLPEENIDLIYTRNKLIRKISKDSIYLDDLKDEYKKLKDEINERNQKIKDGEKINNIIQSCCRNEIYEFAYEYLDNLKNNYIIEKVHEIINNYEISNNSEEIDPIIKFGLKIREKYYKI